MKKGLPKDATVPLPAKGSIAEVAAEIGANAAKLAAGAARANADAQVVAKDAVKVRETLDAMVREAGIGRARDSSGPSDSPGGVRVNHTTSANPTASETDGVTTEEPNRDEMGTSQCNEQCSGEPRSFGR